MESSGQQSTTVGGGAPAVSQKVLDIFYGYCTSRSLFAACELGIFDFLQTAGKPQPANKIAEQLSLDQDATSRLLDVLVSLELLIKQTGTDEDVYTISKEAYCLTKASQSHFHAYVMNTAKVTAILMNNLTSAVREGTNQWERTFKLPSDDVFKNIFYNQVTLMRFLGGMRGLVKSGAKKFITAFDLSRFQRVCDLGGGTGDIAYAACMAYKNMKITVFDLPPVVENSPHFRPSMEECPNQKNVTFVAGNFFEPKLPAADLYVLTHILHDWGEEKIDALLSNVFNNLPSGGGILLGECLLFDDKSGPLIAQMQSLIMFTLCGGRERSGLEYKQLLEKHGLKDVQMKFTQIYGLDAILAVKP